MSNERPLSKATGLFQKNVEDLPFQLNQYLDTHECYNHESKPLCFCDFRSIETTASRIHLHPSKICSITFTQSNAVVSIFSESHTIGSHFLFRNFFLTASKNELHSVLLHHPNQIRNQLPHRLLKSSLVYVWGVHFACEQLE